MARPRTICVENGRRWRRERGWLLRTRHGPCSTACVVTRRRTAPLQRLSVLDAEFLHLEDDRSPMHIGCLCTFEGPAPSAEETARFVGAKLALIPRYRKRVRSVPLELGRPIWVDDPDFDLDRHLRRTTLPAPGDGAALDALLGRPMSRRLARGRPLWELWVVDGLEGGRWALISKVHHSMVDGISGVDLLTTLHDRGRSVTIPPVQPFAPEPEPSRLHMVIDAWRGPFTVRVVPPVTSTFCGLRSRWMMPAACAAATPAVISRSSARAAEMGSGPRRRTRAWRVSPSIYSIEMRSSGPSSPRSWMRITFGWVTLRAAFTSRRSRSTSSSGSAASTDEIVFSATRSQSLASRARYTAPMPPRPSSRSIV
jgi:hypothetical protein